MQIWQSRVDPKNCKYAGGFIYSSAGGTSGSTVRSPG